eukprot:TRINITY_DN2254_c0_g1_i1.p1 TRINITY_DN2254_c0_g1~~TRINITY_DN2254_c0_g1_i1.p1  ORF type:complete len:755 (-),score=111.67 TRINITY_DN2254_c0_g1_i1:120-2384(-)
MPVQFRACSEDPGDGKGDSSDDDHERKASPGASMCRIKTKSGSVNDDFVGARLRIAEKPAGRRSVMPMQKPTMAFGKKKSMAEVQLSSGVQSFVAPNGVEMKYALFVPAGYKRTTPTPFVVSVAGSGQQHINGFSRRLVCDGWAVVVILRPDEAPLMFTGSGKEGEGTWYLHSAVDHIMSYYRVKGGRVLLTGVSNGGSSVLRFATLWPELCCGVVVVTGNLAGLATEADCKRLDGLPLDMYVGTKDEIGFYQTMVQLKAQLKSWNHTPPPQLTIFEGIGHICSTFINGRVLLGKMSFMFLRAGILDEPVTLEGNAKPLDQLAPLHPHEVKEEMRSFACRLDLKVEEVSSFGLRVTKGSTQAKLPESPSAAKGGESPVMVGTAVAGDPGNGGYLNRPANRTSPSAAGSVTSSRPTQSAATNPSEAPGVRFQENRVNSSSPRPAGQSGAAPSVRSELKRAFTFGHQPVGELVTPNSVMAPTVRVQDTSLDSSATVPQRNQLLTSTSGADTRGNPSPSRLLATPNSGCDRGVQSSPMGQFRRARPKDENPGQAEPSNTGGAAYPKKAEPLKTGVATYQKDAEPLKTGVATYQKDAEPLKTGVATYQKEVMVGTAVAGGPSRTAHFATPHSGIAPSAASLQVPIGSARGGGIASSPISQFRRPSPRDDKAESPRTGTAVYQKEVKVGTAVAGGPSRTAHLATPQSTVAPSAASPTKSQLVPPTSGSAHSGGIVSSPISQFRRPARTDENLGQVQKTP